VQELNELRCEIDKLDCEIVKFLSKRFDLLKLVAKIKSKSDAPCGIKDQRREQYILDKINGYYSLDIRKIYLEIFKISCDFQRREIKRLGGV
jgi:chorismate mutase